MSLTPQQVAALIRIGADALDGQITDPKEAARALVGLGLSFVPVADLAPFLDDASKARIDAVVDAAEDVKFPR